MDEDDVAELAEILDDLNDFILDDFITTEYHTPFVKPHPPNRGRHSVFCF